MAHEAPKADPVSKALTAVSAVALLVAVYYLVSALFNTISENTLPPAAETVTAPKVAEAEKPAAPAPAAEAKPEPAAPAAGPNAAAGADLFAAKCASCHGAEGEGMGMFPKVTGLSADDITSKLKAYRAGEQVGPNTALMAPNATGLSDEDIANLAAHLAGDSAAAEEAAPSAAATEKAAPAEAAAGGAGDIAAGKELFASTCASCHGANAEGQGMFPKLAGNAADDVSSKLKAYRAGEQVGPMTSMMAPMAAGLSDEDIANVSAYLSSL